MSIYRATEHEDREARDTEQNQRVGAEPAQGQSPHRIPRKDGDDGPGDFAHDGPEHEGAQGDLGKARRVGDHVARDRREARPDHAPDLSDDADEVSARLREDAKDADVALGPARDGEGGEAGETGTHQGQWQCDDWAVDVAEHDRDGGDRPEEEGSHEVDQRQRQAELEGVRGQVLELGDHPGRRQCQGGHDGDGDEGGHADELAARGPVHHVNAVSRRANALWSPAPAVGVADPVELGVELLAHLEHEELSVADAMDRIEVITDAPARQREILDTAAVRGVIERDGALVRPQRGSYVRFERDVIQREGEFTCQRCGADCTTGHFIRFDAGELGPFGSSCIRKVTGRE